MQLINDPALNKIKATVDNRPFTRWYYSDSSINKSRKFGQENGWTEIKDASRFGIG